MIGTRLPACSESLTIVRARGLHRIGPGGGDESENIRVHLVSLDTIDNWLQTQISAGKKLDAKIYAALYWLSKDNSKDQVNRK
jgi:ADP-ribose pyrophosphatase